MAHSALDLLVLDEVTRIAGEAVFNVWRHASATRIAIDVSHGTNFSLRITDNGVGIDPDVVTRGEREGHFDFPACARAPGGCAACWRCAACRKEGRSGTDGAGIDCVSGTWTPLHLPRAPEGHPVVAPAKARA